MRDRNLSLASDADDLPRTLRREREARERPGHTMHQPGWPDIATPATAKAEMSFFRLMLFSVKAVIAGIPALILLFAIIWAGMAFLKSRYPELIHTRIFIDFNPPSSAPARTPDAVLQKGPAARL